jgi:hypothetical protein
MHRENIMFKTKQIILITALLCSTSATAQTVLELAEQERAKKAGEVTDKASQPKPPSASEIQRRSGKIPLEEISLIGVQGVDGELRAELVSKAGATATLSLAGRRSFGGWTVTDITPDFVVLSASDIKSRAKHTIYLSAVREAKPEPLPVGSGAFNTAPPPIPFPTPSL